MRIVMFYHSLISDWNHGNAHFLRGVVSELLQRGHQVSVYEPRDAWSVRNLVQDQGEDALRHYRRAYPTLASVRYSSDALDLDDALAGAELVLVHEWNDHDLVRRIGEHRRRHGSYRLLFHDTHHRSVTDADSMAAYDLQHYDGVLAFGQVIRDLYLRRGWTERAWVWHEAADTRVFRPERLARPDHDVVWIGNWGDEERTRELNEFFLEPVRQLKLRATAHGVRYPEEALTALKRAEIAYGGWLPNYEAPAAYSRARLTLHIPRRPYVEALPGVPTIRVFEALACGMPLICAPWKDTEGLFAPGKDFLVASDGQEMREQIDHLLCHPRETARLAEHGRKTVLARHTCTHRVNELFAICAQIEQRTEVVA